jgi:hypothetical protein
MGFGLSLRGRVFDSFLREHAALMSSSDALQVRARAQAKPQLVCATDKYWSRFAFSDPPASRAWPHLIAAARRVSNLCVSTTCISGWVLVCLGRDDG